MTILFLYVHVQVSMTLMFIFTTVVPIITFGFAFPRMSQRLSQKKQAVSTKESPAVFQSARRSIQRTLMLLFVSYVVCILPANIIAFLISYRLLPFHMFTSALFHFCISLYFANAIFNPFIFGFHYQHFRRALRSLIHRRVKKATEPKPETEVEVATRNGSDSIRLIRLAAS